MPVRVHARARVIVIAASGDLDVVSRALLDVGVDSALAGSWRVIVVDLGGLDFVDVVGAEPLRRLLDTVPHGRVAVLVNASPQVEATLRRLGLGDGLVPVEELPLASDAAIAELLG